MALYGSIEAGGTKFVCGVGNGPEDLIVDSFPATSPQETIERAVQFFKQFPVEAVGIGSFGPVDLHPDSPTFGYITSTPKSGWAYFDFAGSVKRALGVPVALDTDVNTAAMGEAEWGAARGLSDFIYITVGTGIGGGAMVRGRILHGLVHPEMGHIRLPRNPQEDPFGGLCPYHGDCLEGLASGPAIQARWGLPGQKLPPDHPAWAMEARYLALGLSTLVCTLSPQRVILGGGVMQQGQMFPAIRSELKQLLNGYIQSSAILERIEQYVTPPGLGNRSGVLGGLALAASSIRRAAGV
jgi:fructokinase